MTNLQAHLGNSITVPHCSTGLVASTHLLDSLDGGYTPDYGRPASSPFVSACKFKLLPTTLPRYFPDHAHASIY